MREIQKKMMNHFINFEPAQANFNDDLFMLALSGLVPVDKLLLRMRAVKNIDLKH